MEVETVDPDGRQSPNQRYIETQNSSDASLVPPSQSCHTSIQPQSNVTNCHLKRWNTTYLLTNAIIWQNLKFFTLESVKQSQFNTIDDETFNNILAGTPVDHIYEQKDGNQTIRDEQPQECDDDAASDVLISFTGNKTQIFKCLNLNLQTCLFITITFVNFRLPFKQY